jgi:L-ascorbate metabolism protein UlaG (beta-lactamase superfamily)
MATIRALGHSCFIFSAGPHSVIFDPFLSGNPEGVCGPEDVQVNAVLPSHGHSDHLGDTVAIATRLGCPVIGVYELCLYCQRQGCEIAPMHIGGSRRFDFGEVRLTNAQHGSGVTAADGTIEYTGPACGFIATMAGVSVYFAGDTGLFGDLRLIGDHAAIDVAILPIGDCFTMGPGDAVLAAELIRPRLVIPTHYSAFDAIRQDVNAFAKDLQSAGIDCVPLAPGEELEFEPDA